MRKAFLLVGLVVLACSLAPAQTQTRTPSSKSTQSNSYPAYERWASEDVVYIITAEEKKKFFSFKSDAEREQFITQFWQVHASRAGVPESAFRTEHYRRIAFANQHFGTSKVPGWKTDKGRNYIKTGRV